MDEYKDILQRLDWRINHGSDDILRANRQCGTDILRAVDAIGYKNAKRILQDGGADRWSVCVQYGYWPE